MAQDLKVGELQKSLEPNRLQEKTTQAPAIPTKQVF